MRHQSQPLRFAIMDIIDQEIGGLKTRQQVLTPSFIADVEHRVLALPLEKDRKERVNVATKKHFRCE
ncbi:MAG: hypothetical protein JJ957_11615 [Pseudomonadales bacterium]|nr:hypothetical protein [Pseudomonadales bacterium]MBO6595852.1 hypothetical protein [Pseudomonadales bacterium]